MKLESFSDFAKFMLIIDEGEKSLPYDDATSKPVRCIGKLTIGIGRNLTDRGLSPDEIDYIFQNDLNIVVKDALSIFPKFSTYSLNRKLAICNMLFMGKYKFLGFTEMIRAIKNEDWKRAAVEAQDSKWFRQTKSRGPRVVRLFLEQGDPYGFTA